MHNLKVQELDGRMSGYGQFKYRVELPYSAFRSPFGNNIGKDNDRYATFFEFSKIMTNAYGYGPHVDDAGIYANICKESPAWGFRLGDHAHKYTLYFRDDDAKDHIEKLIVFSKLQQT